MPIKIIDLNMKQFNKMEKVLYSELLQGKEDVSEIEQWMKYRATPNATVYRYVRETGNGIVWRVKV